MIALTKALACPGAPVLAFMAAGAAGRENGSANLRGSMRDFLASLMRSLLRDLALVGVATVLLGTGLALLAPLAPTEAFAGALVACVGLWLLVRFFLNSGEF